MKEGGNMGWKFEKVLCTIFPSRMRMIIMCEWDMVKTVTEKIFPTMMRKFEGFFFECKYYPLR